MSKKYISEFIPFVEDIDQTDNDDGTVQYVIFFEDKSQIKLEFDDPEDVDGVVSIADHGPLAEEFEKLYQEVTFLDIDFTMFVERFFKP